MKRYMKKIVGILLAMSILLIQGCSLVEPETSHLVTISEDGKTLTAALKASTDDGYEWQYILEENNLTEITKNVSNNMFSNTYGTTYTFTAAGDGKNVFDLILVKDGDYDNARVFSYALDVDTDGNITIEKEADFLLGSNIKLYKRVTGS